jgi:hypothetical protein
VELFFDFPGVEVKINVAQKSSHCWMWLEPPLAPLLHSKNHLANQNAARVHGLVSGGVVEGCCNPVVDAQPATDIHYDGGRRRCQIIHENDVDIVSQRIDPWLKIVCVEANRDTIEVALDNDVRALPALLLAR